jgi:virginiamycin B lyase
LEIRGEPAHGNLWFTEYTSLANKIGRISPKGTISEFAIPTQDSLAQGITTGADGNVWFTESGGDKIGRITATGKIAQYPI